MPSPETREVRQCVYTPIRNAPDVRFDLPGFSPRQPLLDASILERAFGGAAPAKVILSQLRASGLAQEVPDFEAVAGAVDSLWRHGGAVAARRLRSVDRNAVLEVSRRALALRREWARTADDALTATTLEELQDKSDDGGTTLEKLRAEMIRGHERLSAEIRGQAAPLVASTAIPASMARPEPRLSRVLSRIASTSRTGLEWLAATGATAIPDAGGAGFISLPLTSEDFSAFDRAGRMGLLGGIGWLFEDIERAEKTLDALAELSAIEPVGFLHLERLTFTPVGYRRGELVYSIPLVAGEHIRFTHREWTRTETEYEEITSTSLETAVEDTLSEKSELAESVGTENQRSSALDASVDAEGGYGPVSISTHVGYNLEESERTTREQTAKRAQEVTRRASTRAKKEHKVTFRVTRETGIEDESYREIVNTTDDAVRWDFYRMMREWEIDLYRYGVRLTYDVVLPEPGSYLLRRYQRLAAIDAELGAESSLPIAVSGITRETWQDLASEYGAALSAPPEERVHVVATASESGNNIVAFRHVDVQLPEGYWFESWDAEGESIRRDRGSAGFIEPLKAENSARLNAGLRKSNRYPWQYLFDSSNREDLGGGDVLTITVRATGELTESALASWQAESHSRLVEAFDAHRAAQVERLQTERMALVSALTEVDALVLRKLEKEEVMKAVLRLMLGPSFRFYPPGLPKLGAGSDEDIALFDPESGALLEGVAGDLLAHGQIIRFLHHAIEWENINYVLYPYFWTDTDRWDLKQALDHPDYVHRNFLRAGAARVVLTIRPGFEPAFLSFMETSDTEERLPDEHPYMRLAEEVRAMAEERYPFTPGGIVLDEANRVDRWHDFTPTGALDVARGEPL